MKLWGINARQKDRKTERQKDRKTERQKDRKTERQKDRKTVSIQLKTVETWVLKLSIISLLSRLFFVTVDNFLTV